MSYGIVNITRWFVAGLLALSLLLQTLAVSAHTRIQTTDLQIDANGYQTIVICTGTGLRKIVIDQEGNLIDDEKIPGKTVYCPLCLSLADDIHRPNPITIQAVKLTANPHFDTHINAIVNSNKPDDLNCLDPPHKT